MDKYLYSEVYIIGVDSTVLAHGDLTVCTSFEDLLNYLKTKNASINSDLRVLHGVLTSAKTIPEDLMGRQPFIIFKDPNTQGGIMLDADTDDDCHELASEIEMCMESEEVASFFFEIEHVYILYGYELQLTLSIAEEDLDEEFIVDCLKIGKAARKLKEDDNNE